MTRDLYQCGVVYQQRRSRAVWLEPLPVASIYYDSKDTDRTSFGVSKLKRRLHRLIWVWVSACQNATLLEITCRGWNVFMYSNKYTHFIPGTETVGFSDRPTITVFCTKCLVLLFPILKFQKKKKKLSSILYISRESSSD